MHNFPGGLFITLPPTHTFGRDPGFCWSQAPGRQPAATPGGPQALQTELCWHISLQLLGEVNGRCCDGNKEGKDKVNKT